MQTRGKISAINNHQKKAEPDRFRIALTLNEAERFQIALKADLSILTTIQGKEKASLDERILEEAVARLPGGEAAIPLGARLLTLGSSEAEAGIKV